MQEVDNSQAKTKWRVGRQWVLCIIAYTLIWSFTFSLLWFAVSAGIETLIHITDFGQVLLSLAFNVLCPDWLPLGVGLLLGLLTCLGLRLFRGAVLASLVVSLLPASAILYMFGFSPSGILPALCTVASSGLAGFIVARTWQRSLFAVSYSEGSFAVKRVVTVLLCLLVLSIPFRLFQGASIAWSGVLPAKITETNPLPSPDGIYIASIHNVDPNIGDYSDVVIRPRHSILDLFCGYSASSRLDGIERVQWTDKRTLYIWRDYDPGVQHWHDVRIVYVDTSSTEEKRENAAMKKYLAGH